MTVATSRRPKAAVVPSKAIDQVKSLLQQLPEKPKESLSLRETVAKLQDQIKAALAKGYSYEEVAQLLNQQGISISPSTLKNYIPSGRRQAAAEEPEVTKTRKRRSKKQQSDESAASDAESPLTLLATGAVDSAKASSNGAAPTADHADTPVEDSEAETSEETTESDVPAKKPGRRGRPSAASKAKSAAKPASETKTKPTRGRPSAAAKSTSTPTTTRRRKKTDA